MVPEPSSKTSFVYANTTQKRRECDFNKFSMFNCSASSRIPLLSHFHTGALHSDAHCRQVLRGSLYSKRSLCAKRFVEFSSFQLYTRYTGTFLSPQTIALLCRRETLHSSYFSATASFVSAALPQKVPSSSVLTTAAYRKLLFPYPSRVSVIFYIPALLLIRIYRA